MTNPGNRYKPIRNNEERIPDAREELYEEHLDDQTKDESTIQKFPPVYALFLLILFGMSWYIVQKKYMTSWEVAPYLIIGGGFIIYMGLRKAKVEIMDDNYFISERRAKAILWGELKYKQHNSPDEVPLGEIKLQLHCKMISWNGKPWRWDIGYKIQKHDGRDVWYVAGLDAKNGKIIEIFPRPEGFGPKDSPHVITRKIEKKEDDKKDEKGKR